MKMVKTMEKIDVIYLSGGIGKRAKLGYPKQFARIDGKPIIIYGLEVLNKIDEIGKIIIPAADITKTNEILLAYNLEKIFLIDGGKTRQDSVLKGLKHVKSDYVLIMEAVRPFVTVEFITDIINMKCKNNFVVPISQPVSTVICSWGQIIDRDLVGEVQMPQKYLTKLLKDCHLKAFESNILYTDDAALVVANSKETPNIITGIETNIKITTPLDLKIAEGIYSYIKNI
jgi:2-C-methyl-D-erythritol 4-phosphate cytidylyltransferase